MDWEVAIMIRKGKDCGLEYGMISETGASEPFVDLLRPSGFSDVGIETTVKECLIYAMLLANPVQNGSSDASDVQFWSEFW